MLFVAQAVVALIALLHVYILVLEMFLWDKPQGRKAFGLRTCSSSFQGVRCPQKAVLQGANRRRAGGPTRICLRSRAAF